MPPRPHGNVSMKSVNKKTVFRLLSYFKNYKFAVDPGDDLPCPYGRFPAWWA